MSALTAARTAVYLHSQHKGVAARTMARAALRAAPDDPEVLLLASSVFMCTPYAGEAVSMLRKAIALGADQEGPAGHNHAIAQLYDGFPRLAVESLRQLESSPGVDHDLGSILCYLDDGQYGEGLALREARAKLLGYQDFGLPAWRGERVSTLLVHAEQGIGDTLQFTRYLKWAHSLCDTLILMVPAELLELLREYPMADGCYIARPGEIMPTASALVPIMSLQHLYRLAGEKDPPEAEVDFYMSRAEYPGPAGGEFNVGVVWRGSPRHQLDEWRSIPLEQIAWLFEDPSVSWLSLQVCGGAADEELTSSGLDALVGRWVSPNWNWRQTVGALLKLDLLVTVDTAIAHLAGSMGVPTFLMLPAVPDWRWGRAGSTTPLYPRTTLFRQRVYGNWAPVVRAVSAAVAAHRTSK